VREPARDIMSIVDYGYAPHAFNEEGEKKLWELSFKIAGVEVEK
jgi:hypothetical protein